MSHTQPASPSPSQSTSFQFQPKRTDQSVSDVVAQHPSWFDIFFVYVIRPARLHILYLTMIAGPAGDVFLWLDVIHRAQGPDSGLGDDGPQDLTFHGDKGVPVVWDLLVGSQFQLARQ